MSEGVVRKWGQGDREQRGSGRAPAGGLNNDFTLKEMEAPGEYQAGR